MKHVIIQVVINITIPIFLVLLFANILTTKPYLMISKGLYESHDLITYDHDYAVDRIMGYLNYRYDDLLFGATPEDDTVIMRDTEISHMVDVKNLYTMLRVVGLASVVVGGALIYYQWKTDKSELYKTLKTMPYGPIFFVTFVGGYILIDFNTAFTVFHEIFFSNDDWKLFADDVLILLLPQNFWMVSGLLILVAFSASMLGIRVVNEKILKKRYL
jgi:integral membrane protein (TIGR01906 family)